ncbi:MAG: NAD(P)-dependent dehydrogenase (short-subunit alcohol dehydrogenase family) [Flavobacterium sp.]|jgi:NAD(P)-dependent dehydrogenase (short-subunit alcohol dehydrogenase family)
MNMLTNKIIIITGATSGIGKATAIGAAKEGATIVLAGRREKEGAAIVKAICADGGNAEFVRCDVLVEDDIRSLVEGTVKKFGRLDGAFNNAGILGGVGSLDQLPNNEFDHVFNVNLRSLFWSLQYESAAMKTHGGTIVNCGSAASVVGAAGFATYSATMHALVGLTKSSAIDNAPLGIRINAVLP